MSHPTPQKGQSNTSRSSPYSSPYSLSSNTPRAPIRPITAPSSNAQHSVTKRTNNLHVIHTPVPAAPAPTLSPSIPPASPEPDLTALITQFYTAFKEENRSLFISTLSSIRSYTLYHSLTDASPLRSSLWSALLGIGSVSATDYVALVTAGKSNMYGKIRGDSFRTFPNEKLFQSKVTEAQLVRILNSFVIQYSQLPSTKSTQPTSSTTEVSSTSSTTTSLLPSNLSPYQFTYCQGMNSIAAPFLYCLSELQSYSAFSIFITTHTPLYWISSHIGVEAGCRLVDQVLCLVDNELYLYLTKNYNLTAYVYAFHAISSFSASVPPFSELLCIWDFLLSYGLYMNILLVVAQILSKREEILNSNQPKHLLDYRKWPNLRSKYLIFIAMGLIQFLNTELYIDIQKHAWDIPTAEKITGRKVERGKNNTWTKA